MKIIFVVNPQAGKGKGIDKLKDRINRVAESTGIPAGFYLTKSVGDAGRRGSAKRRSNKDRPDKI